MAVTRNALSQTSWQLPLQKPTGNIIHTWRHRRAVFIQIVHITRTLKYSVITNSMEQSPCWETSSLAANQEVTFLLWNPTVHYSIDKSPPLAPLLGKMNAVNNFQLHLSDIHSYIILPSMPRSSELFFFLLGFPNKILYALVCVLYALPISSSLIDRPNIWWGLQVVKLLIMYSSPACRYFLPLRSKYYALQSVWNQIQYFVELHGLS